jgi:hypothetical protein
MHIIYMSRGVGWREPIHRQRKDDCERLVPDRRTAPRGKTVGAGRAVRPAHARRLRTVGLQSARRRPGLKLVDVAGQDPNIEQYALLPGPPAPGARNRKELRYRKSWTDCNGSDHAGSSPRCRWWQAGIGTSFIPLGITGFPAQGEAKVGPSRPSCSTAYYRSVSKLLTCVFW